MFIWRGRWGSGAWQSQPNLPPTVGSYELNDIYYACQTKRTERRATSVSSFSFLILNYCETSLQTFVNTPLSPQRSSQIFNQDKIDDSRKFDAIRKKHRLTIIVTQFNANLKMRWKSRLRKINVDFANSIKIGVEIMTNEQRNEKILKAIETQTKRALVSKKVARQTLIDEGIYTTKGKLRVEFGGERNKKHEAA